MPDTDDDWFDQLRDAVVTGADSPPEPARPEAPENGHARSEGDATSGLDDIGDAIRSLDARTTTIESLVEEIASVVRRASSGPRAGDLETMIARVLRAELPGLFEELLGTLPASVSAGTDLRSRITELEELHRQMVAQLAEDRRALIDDAVREIRTLLFGQ